MSAASLAMPPAKKVRVKLSTSMAGKDFSHKPDAVIEVSQAEADRHVANGNGLIVDGEISEIDKLKLENEKLQATILSMRGEDSKAPKK